VDVYKDDLVFFSKKESNTFIIIGETILGIPKSELGTDYIYAGDRYCITLDKHLHRSIHLLLYLVNSFLMCLIIGRNFGGLSKMSIEKRKKYLNRWKNNKIPLFRTSFVTLKALSGWSIYSLEKTWEEIKYPGSPIGREDKIPTLLYGKHPWRRPQ